MVAAGMAQGSYLPVLPEILITVACFSGLILLYAVFTRYFPIVPIWETAQGHLKQAQPTEHSPAHSTAASD